eukprot:332154-Pelagomonas_calceolata.AAC.1
MDLEDHDHAVKVVKRPRLTLQEEPGTQMTVSGCMVEFRTLHWAARHSEAKCSPSFIRPTALHLHCVQDECMKLKKQAEVVWVSSMHHAGVGSPKVQGMHTSESAS